MSITSVATTVCFVFPRSSIFIFSRSTLNLVENISMLFSASLIESGPNLVPGLKECVESNGIPYTVVDILLSSFGLVINGFLFM